MVLSTKSNKVTLTHLLIATQVKPTRQDSNSNRHSVTDIFQVWLFASLFIFVNFYFKPFDATDEVQYKIYKMVICFIQIINLVRYSVVSSYWYNGYCFCVNIKRCILQLCYLCGKVYRL